MAVKKTHEEYVRQVTEKAPHIQVIGQYDGNRTPIEHYCFKHNVTWNVSPFNFLQHPTGCKKCQEEALQKYHKSIRKTNKQFINEVKALNTGIIPLDEYKGWNEKILFQCKHGHIWYSTPHDVLAGYGCPYCAGNAILKGYNDLWTTNPDIANMLYNPDIGYEVGKGSHRNVEWICPNCGTHKFSSPKQVVRYGLACSKCSDGISYPNKFIVSLLSQLDVDVFTPEWSPEWIGRYRYDVYFTLNNNEYIVEMDGGIGHGCVDFKTGEQDKDGLNRDIIKNLKAQDHNITLIRIDCNYQHMSKRFSYIKQSILNSELKYVLNLTDIDWEKCNREATKSLHMEAAKQYEEGMSIHEIANNLKVSYSTIYNWLKRLSTEGLCSYKPAIGRKKNS